MEIPFDVVGIIGAKLSPTTLSSLSVAARTFTTGIEAVKKTALFWKSRAEHLAGISLPFEPTGDPVKYWSDIAINLQNSVDNDDALFINLFRLGIYEYIYIVVQQGTSRTLHDIDAAIIAAISNDSVNSIVLLYNHFTRSFSREINGYIEKAIDHRSNNVLRQLLTYTKELGDTIPFTYGDSPVTIAITAQNIDAMLIILEMDPPTLKKCKHILRTIREQSKREKLLDSFLHAYPNNYGNISNYYDNIYATKVTGDEMEILLSSNMFTIDKEYDGISLFPEAAYKLLKLDFIEGIVDSAPSVYKSRLLYSLIDNADLLDTVLAYIRPDSYYLWPRVLKSKSMAWQVLINYYSLDIATADEQIRKCITSYFSPQAMTGICNHVGITIQDLEVIIAESSNMFIEESVESIIELGVPLRRSSTDRFLIGEKLAFNCEPYGWEVLANAGFDFDACGTDLLKKVLTYHSSDFFNFLLSYLTQYNTEEVYAMSSWLSNLAITKKDVRRKTVSKNVYNVTGGSEYYEKYYNTAPEFVYLVMLGTSIAKYVQILEDGVAWESIFDYPHSYEWLDKIPASLTKNPLMIAGIQIMKKTIERKLLRDYDHNTTNNFIVWLSLARGLRSKVSVATGLMNKLHIAVIIDRDIVILRNSTNHPGKYKYLDLFSDDGILLTTKQAIRERRNELQQS